MLFAGPDLHKHDCNTGEHEPSELRAFFFEAMIHGESLKKNLSFI